ncbi:AOX-domain-containing protein [Panus rudis PR-1116 ss-1]|nr:AOX-domain-containing protein [Panus rudis PR-1116 ss-1]
MSTTPTLRGAIPTNPSPQVQTVLRWIKGICDADLQTLEELLAPEFEVRFGPESVKRPPSSKEGFLEFLKGLTKQMVPGMKVEIHEIIESDGRVVVHLTTDGMLITNQPYTHNMIHTYRLKNEGGKLLFTSIFEFLDSLTFMWDSFKSKPLKVSTPESTAHVGVEGPHRKDIPPASAASPTGDHLSPEKASTLAKDDTHVKGDWVLFHPVYTPEELRAVEVLHHNAKTFSDKLAANFVRILRWGFDFISGYKHKPIPPNSNMTVEELRKGGYIMSEDQWLQRILFLESIAAVPGMVAATLRHLRSLRLMRRDAGWIHTLLEEAENERMHLMTFMTIKKPSPFFRLLVIGAQGVFYNMFFLSYLMSPRTCHRFVGILEEEAVVTYTRCIQDIEAGRIPGWTNMPAPAIAIDYWRLEPDAKLLDVIYAVRSDETTHRFVNHSLANINPATDVNPFALREPDMNVKGKKLAFEREEAEKYVQESLKMIEEGRHQQH